MNLVEMSLTYPVFTCMFNTVCIVDTSVCLHSIDCVLIPIPERDELQHRVQELDSQMTDLLQKNRDLQVENEEIAVLRDSLEEMKYMESKVVSHMTSCDGHMIYHMIPE